MGNLGYLKDVIWAGPKKNRFTDRYPNGLSEAERLLVLFSMWILFLMGHHKKNTDNYFIPGEIPPRVHPISIYQNGPIHCFDTESLWWSLQGLLFTNEIYLSDGPSKRKQKSLHWSIPILIHLKLLWSSTTLDTKTSICRIYEQIIQKNEAFGMTENFSRMSRKLYSWNEASGMTENFSRMFRKLIPGIVRSQTMIVFKVLVVHSCPTEPS